MSTVYHRMTCFILVWGNNRLIIIYYYSVIINRIEIDINLFFFLQ